MSIEFHEYIRPTRLDADGGVMLGVRLIKSKPSDMSAAEKRALKRVRAATVEVQRVAKLRDRLRPQNLKDEDRRFDAGWGAVHGELEAWARLSDTARGRTAAELLTSLFPDGLMFLTRKYEQQWVESQRRFERIEEEALEDTLASLVHPEILAYARAAHDALGEGLGAGAVPLEAPDGATLLDALRTLALAVAAYARVLVGSVDDLEPATIDRFRAAMAPLAAYRASQGRNTSEGPAEDVVEDVGPIDDGPSLDEPVPPVT